MPTNKHELPLEMVRNRPQLVPELLRSVFGLDVPDLVSTTLTSESYADVNPAELRCDATVLLGDPKRPRLGVVVESQLRPRDQKSYSWPAYLASLRQRRKCPVMLLVLCPDKGTARGCAAPIDMGHPGWVLNPLTVHPGMLPPIVDPGQARLLPELAVLAAPVHAEGPEAKAVLDSLTDALHSVAGDTRKLYYDYVTSRFSDAARKLLEETMSVKGYEWESDFAKSHRAEGREEGRAEGREEGHAEGREEGHAEGEVRALLLVLQSRGIAVSDEVRGRVEGCTDLDQIERWIRRASTVDTAADLFA
ncbi:hypothetical protein [Spirillospora sp. NPDC048819]|uniref:hypothetical protein n=1 Tax=Spirillospora sp. NPDC048819 TaxID=3155268 RepID=UPI0033F8DFC5